MSCQGTEAIEPSLDKSFGLLRDIGRQGDDFRLTPQFRRRLVERVCSSRRDHEPRASIRVLPRDLQPQALRSTRYQCHAVL